MASRPRAVSAAVLVAVVQSALVARAELEFPPWTFGRSILPLLGAVCLAVAAAAVLRRSLAAAGVVLAVELCVLVGAVVSLANPPAPYVSGIDDVDARTSQLLTSLFTVAVAVTVAFLLLQPASRAWLGAPTGLRAHDAEGRRAARRDRPPGVVVVVAVLFGLQGAVTIGTAIFATGRVDGSVLVVPAALGVALAVAAAGLVARQVWARYVAIGAQVWVFLRATAAALSEASSASSPGAYLLGALVALAVFAGAVVVLLTPSVRSWFAGEPSRSDPPEPPPVRVPPGWRSD